MNDVHGSFSVSACRAVGGWLVCHPCGGRDPAAGSGVRLRVVLGSLPNE